jgi:hypothetical protein
MHQKTRIPFGPVDAKNELTTRFEHLTPIDPTFAASIEIRPSDSISGMLDLMIVVRRSPDATGEVPDNVEFYFTRQLSIARLLDGHLLDLVSFVTHGISDWSTLHTYAVEAFLRTHGSVTFSFDDVGGPAVSFAVLGVEFITEIDEETYNDLFVGPPYES